MARSDLLIELVRAGVRGDQTTLRRSVEALVADERQKQHHVLADRLAGLLAGNGKPAPHPDGGPPRQPNSGADYVLELMPSRVLADLQLTSEVQESVGDLIEETVRADLLRSYNLEPRHRILLMGPPGNGKTALAEAIAGELALPLFVVRYEALIGSYLGETSARIGRLFDYVRMRPCVLFFDEFDVVGKERGDEHETGEIKRVVSTLLLQLDQLPSYVIAVGATNHAELLDRAVWRRFQIILRLAAPNVSEIRSWLKRLFKHLELPVKLPSVDALQSLEGMSYAELEQVALDTKRLFILRQPRSNASAIFKHVLAGWSARRQQA